MSDYGKRIRLNRILGVQPRGTLVVAFDHALVLGRIPGTENPTGQIARFVGARVNAILLNLGLLKSCIACFPRGGTPGLIARIDWTTVLSALDQTEKGALHSCMLARPEEALHLGADAVLSYLLVGTGEAAFESNEIRRNARIARECERIGIPLIVETLARGKAVENPGDPKWLSLHTRIAAELGADLIKTDYSGSVATMRQIVQDCPIPILVLGGSRNDAALDRITDAMSAGAAGVFFGRNVFQSKDIDSFLKNARTILDGIETPASRNREGAP